MDVKMGFFISDLFCMIFLNYCFRFLNYLLLADRTGPSSFPFQWFPWSISNSIQSSKGLRPVLIFKTFLKRTYPCKLLNTHANRTRYSNTHATWWRYNTELIYKITYEEQCWRKQASSLTHSFKVCLHSYSQQDATNNLSTLMFLLTSLLLSWYYEEVEGPFCASSAA